MEGYGIGTYIYTNVYILSKPKERFDLCNEQDKDRNVKYIL